MSTCKLRSPDAPTPAKALPMQGLRNLKLGPRLYYKWDKITLLQRSQGLFGTHTRRLLSPTSSTHLGSIPTSVANDP